MFEQLHTLPQKAQALADLASQLRAENLDLRAQIAEHKMALLEKENKLELARNKLRDLLVRMPHSGGEVT